MNRFMMWAEGNFDSSAKAYGKQMLNSQEFQVPRKAYELLATITCP